jgi:SAM-dependent methyltransferase
LKVSKIVPGSPVPVEPLGANVTAPKVFLSYARVDADRKFVSDLYRRLKQDGIDCFFDEVWLAPGANFVLQISEAVEKCNYLVMVMSRAYFSARFAPSEWSAVLAGDPKNERGRLVPLLREDCELPALIKPLLFIDVRSAETFEQSYARIWQRVGRLEPNDIEERSREIDELFRQDKAEQAVKRSLDFARDFAKQREPINRFTAIKWAFDHLKKESNVRTRMMSQVDLVEDVLNLRDSIIDTLSLEVVR